MMSCVIHLRIHIGISPVLETFNGLFEPCPQMSYAHLFLLQRGQVLLRRRWLNTMVICAGGVLYMPSGKEEYGSC